LFFVREVPKKERWTFDVQSVQWWTFAFQTSPDEGQIMPKVLRDYEVYLVYVDPDRCDSCEECIIMCPTDVFEMPHKAIPVRPQNCMGCLTCTAVCKSKAVIITEI
jgi:ferredoxin